MCYLHSHDRKEVMKSPKLHHQAVIAACGPLIPTALILGAVGRHRLPLHRTPLPSSEPEPHASSWMSLQDLPPHHLSSVCPIWPWLLHPAQVDPLRHPERGPSISIFETPRSQRSVHLFKINSVYHRLGFLEADTKLECKKFIRDQYLWKQRERSRMEQRDNQTEVLAKLWPTWTGAMEYVPCPTEMSWVRPRCLGIYTPACLSHEMQADQESMTLAPQMRLTLTEVMAGCCPTTWPL